MPRKFVGPRGQEVGVESARSVRLRVEGESFRFCSKSMKIRLMEKKDIRVVVIIVGRNYSKTYECLSVFELKNIFNKSACKPTYFATEENGKIVKFAGF